MNSWTWWSQQKHSDVTRQKNMFYHFISGFFQISWNMHMTKFCKIFAPVVYRYPHIGSMVPYFSWHQSPSWAGWYLSLWDPPGTTHQNWGWVSTLPLKLAALVKQDGWMWDVIWFACFWLTILYTLCKRLHVFHTFACYTVEESYILLFDIVSHVHIGSGR